MNKYLLPIATFAFLILWSFKGYSAERPTLSAYYGLNFPYESQRILKENPSDEYVSKSVAYSKVGILDFVVERKHTKLLVEIDYNFGELYFTKIYNGNVYQTGTYYFPAEDIVVDSKF